jgi:hypothetical protein
MYKNILRMNGDNWCFKLEQAAMFERFIKALPEIDRLDIETCKYDWILTMHIKDGLKPIVAKKINQWKRENGFV